MNAKQITNDLFWVGTLDPDLKYFDIIIPTEVGTSYNSYILKGSEHIALIETAKMNLMDEFLERLSTVTTPEKIDYVIIDHAEPDHSGSLIKIFELNPNIEVIGSAQAIKSALKITGYPLKTRVVKDGDTLELGGKTLKFISAPFLHWPDTIFTYCIEDKTLFTCDVFGCHFCPSADKLFSDEADQETYKAAYKYYFDCIMSPFKQYALQAIAKIEDLPIEMVCTGHGPLLRKGIIEAINLYKTWSTVELPAKPFVVLASCSAYGFTKQIEENILRGLQDSGVDVFVFDFAIHSTKEILDKIELAKGIIIGSPTFLSDALPPVWQLLIELNPIIHRGKIAGAFGAYGWGGEAVSNIEQRFNQLRFKIPVPGLRVMFRSNDEEIQKGYDFGKQFGEAVLK